MLYKLSGMAKAVVAAVAAGGAALGMAAQDGNIDVADLVAVVISVLGALGVTYVVPNKG